MADVIIASSPEIVAATPEKVYDIWFLENFQIRASADRTQPIDLEVFWLKGRLLKETIDGVETVVGYETNPATRTNYIVRDLFNPEVLSQHPEIASLMPQFMPALEAVGKRLGVL
jgi:hypothetical protein